MAQPVSGLARPRLVTNRGDQIRSANGRIIALHRVEDEFYLVPTPSNPLRIPSPAKDSARGAVLGRVSRSGEEQGALVRSEHRQRSTVAAECGAAFASAVYVDPVSGKRMIPGQDLFCRLAAGRTAQELKAEFSAAGVKAVEPVGPRSLGIWRLRLLDPFRGDALASARLLSEGGKVEWAEPNFTRELDRRFTPSDPLFPSQVSHHNSGQNSASPNADVNAPEAWDTSRGEPSVVIAIIDDGVDTTHPDLRIQLNPGESGSGREDNGIDDDGNGLVDDVRGWDFADEDNDPSPVGFNGHGTGCAGIAAAIGNNGLGISGIAPNCAILPLKIADDSGLFTSDEAISLAILYAAEHADVLSNSYGGGSPSAFIDAAITHAAHLGRGGRGCPVFFATGNNASTWEQGGGRYRLSTASLSGRYRYGFFFYQGPDFAGENAVRIDDVCLIAEDGHTHLDEVLPREDFEGFFFPPPGWLLAWNNNFPAYWELSADNTFSGTGGFVSAKSPSVATNQYAWLFTPAFDITGTETFAFAMSTDMPTNSYFFVDVYNEDFTEYIGSYGPLNWEPEVDPNTSYPATSPDAIAVGASTDRDRRSDYSQYGGKLDFVAPSNGGWNDIVTLDPVGSVGWTDGDAKMNFGGTSSACPMAAGVAALVLSRNPALGATQVRDLLRATCDRIGNVPYSNGVHPEYGYGRINAAAALVAASTAPRIHPGPAPEPYLENGPAVAVWPEATVSDPDSLDFDQGLLEFALEAQIDASDAVFIESVGLSTGQIAVVDNSVYFGGVELGPLTVHSNQTQSIALTSNATPVSVQALVRQLRFRTDSEAPSPLDRRVRLLLHDEDGDSTVPLIQVVRVVPVNDPPTLDIIPSPEPIWEDAPEQIILLSGIGPGMGETQTVTLTASRDDSGILHPPEVDPAGTNATTHLRYLTLPDQNGTAWVEVTVDDGQSESNTVSRSFPISVLPVNDPPHFSVGPGQTVPFGTATQQVVNAWAQGISTGGAFDEQGQVLHFVVSEVGFSGLFSQSPELGPDGTLVYTPMGNAGTGTFSVILVDDGGTARDGLDTSAPQHFTLTIAEPVPDYRVTVAGGRMTVTDLSGLGDDLFIDPVDATHLQVSATGRTFSVNHGPFLTGDTGPLSLASITNIWIDANGGDDTLYLGTFTNGLPSLELSTGHGHDRVELTGSLQFASNASFHVRFQDPADSPSLDTLGVTTNGMVTTEGMGRIEILGFRQAGLATGAVLRTDAADLVLSGQREDPLGMLPPAIFNLAGGTVTSRSGRVSLFTDRVELHGCVSSALLAVQVAPATPGRPMQLGGAGSSNALHIAANGLACLLAPRLEFGDEHTGDLWLTAMTTPTQTVGVVLSSGARILDASTNVVDVSITSVIVQGQLAQASPPGVWSMEGDLVLKGALELRFAGLQPGTEHDALEVSGRVDLDPLTQLETLALPGFHPSPGQILTVVQRTGGDGTFAGLDEGAVLPSFLGSTDSARISYTGGDGDDIVLTVLDTTAPTLVCPATFTVSCLGDVPTPDPLSVQASDPAGPVVVTHVGDDTTGNLAEGFLIRRTYQAMDALGNAASCAQDLLVQDTEPPVLTGAGSNGVMECGQPLSFTPPLATDACDPSPVLTFTDTIQVGTNAWETVTTRTWTAVDAAGNGAATSQSLLSMDRTAPSMTCPNGATVRRLADLPPVVPGLVLALDACDATPLVTHVGDEVSGSLATGYTVVRTYAAVDEALNRATCMQTFFTSAPSLAVTDDQVLPLDNGLSTLALGVVTVGNTGAWHTVTLTNGGNAELVLEDVAFADGFSPNFAVDTNWMNRVLAAGESTGFRVRFEPQASGIATAVVHIVSNDELASPFVLRLQGTGNAPPQLDLPGEPRLFTATSSAGVAVVFADLATDEEDGTLIPSFTPPSGSLFPIGDTVVTVTAVDSQGGVATGSFIVRVACDPLSLRIAGQSGDLGGACAGTSVELMVSLEADPDFGPVGVRWYRDGVPVPAGTNAVLRLDPITDLDTGVYRAVVSNGCAGVESNPILVQVNCAPICLDDCDGTLANTTRLLSIAKVLANDEDPDGDPLFLRAVDHPSTLGGAVSLEAGGIRYTPPVDAVGIDAIHYVAEDGRGGLGIGRIDVTILAAGNPRFESPAGRWTQAGPVLRFLGLPCHSYVLERADRIQGPYLPLPLLVAPADGWVEHLDLTAPGLNDTATQAWFYRLRSSE